VSLIPLIISLHSYCALSSSFLPPAALPLMRLSSRLLHALQFPATLLPHPVSSQSPSSSLQLPGQSNTDHPLSHFCQARGITRTHSHALARTYIVPLALTHSHACQGPSQQEYAYQSRILSVMPGRFFRQIWDGLERCWEDFESLRHKAGGIGTVGGSLIHGEDVERFVSVWQVFIFECLNVIWEALKQRMVAQTNGSPDSSGNSHTDRVLSRLHIQATRRCHASFPASLLF
jgi:hypothetical protein